APSAPPAPSAAWAVQLIGDRLESNALSRYAQLQKKYQAILGGREPLLVRTTMGNAAIWHRIKIAADTREAAEMLCSRLPAAAGGGRQWPRPEQLNVARRTLALSLRGWHGGPRPQQHLLAHDGGAALGDRIAAPLDERREAFQAARKNRNLVCAIIRLRTSLQTTTHAAGLQGAATSPAPSSPQEPLGAPPGGPQSVTDGSRLGWLSGSGGLNCDVVETDMATSANRAPTSLSSSIIPISGRICSWVRSKSCSSVCGWLLRRRRRRCWRSALALAQTARFGARG